MISRRKRTPREASQSLPAEADPLTIEEFRRVEMRVGRITAVEDFPRARNPSYKLTIDLGALGTRPSSAALKRWYMPEELVGREVVCVVNFAPRNIAGFMSEVLVLGATEDDGRLRLLAPDTEATLGAPIT